MRVSGVRVGGNHELLGDGVFTIIAIYRFVNDVKVLISPALGQVLIPLTYGAPRAAEGVC